MSNHLKFRFLSFRLKKIANDVHEQEVKQQGQLVTDIKVGL